MHSSSLVRGAFWVAIAAMAFFAMAASSPQCAQSTQDRSLNPVFSPLANDCIHKCQSDFLTVQRKNRMDFKTAKNACNGDDDCVSLAAQDKRDADAENTETKDQCKLDCSEHNQGGATGGQ